MEGCKARDQGSHEAVQRRDLKQKRIAEERNCRCLGVYFCKGFDTFGPFRLIGGINKGRPNEAEIQGAVRFFEGLERGGAER